MKRDGARTWYVIRTYVQKLSLLVWIPRVRVQRRKMSTVEDILFSSQTLQFVLEDHTRSIQFTALIPPSPLPFAIMTYYHRVILYFDGASRHNPHGPAGWLVVACEIAKIDEGSEYLGYSQCVKQSSGIPRPGEWIRLCLETYQLQSSFYSRRF